MRRAAIALALLGGWVVPTPAAPVQPVDPVQPVAPVPPVPRGSCSTGVDIVVAHDLPFPHIDDITCGAPCDAGCRKALRGSPHGDVYTCLCTDGQDAGGCDLGVTVPGGNIVTLGDCPASCRIRLQILSFLPFESRAVLRCR